MIMARNVLIWHVTFWNHYFIHSCTIHCNHVGGPPSKIKAQTLYVFRKHDLNIIVDARIINRLCLCIVELFPNMIYVIILVKFVRNCWVIYLDSALDNTSTPSICLCSHSSLGLNSLSGKTSYCKISRNLDAARFGFRLFRSLRNLTGTPAAALPRCLSNLKAIRPSKHPISRFRDFKRFDGKTSYHWVNTVLLMPPEPMSFISPFIQLLAVHICSSVTQHIQHPLLQCVSPFPCA